VGFSGVFVILYDLLMEFSKENWTEDLKKIKPGVKNLFYKGNLDLLINDSPKLAIVGSRRMTDYGARVVEKWMPVLVSRGITIVSGFMYGVDQAAHKACLDNGGKTIAVLGWGIDFQVSSEDVDLYQKLIETNSLIVSEYPDETAPDTWKFPQRNRIVAGISDAVLVIEAAERSGSLITARLANNFGKKLLAVPGQVFSRVATGANHLIKTGRAKMVTTADDILFEMGLNEGQMKLPLGQPKILHDPILALLADGERTVDELSNVLKIKMPVLLSRLTGLTLAGRVREIEGKYRME
jgi:DNA processing protein